MTKRTTRVAVLREAFRARASPTSRDLGVRVAAFGDIKWAQATCRQSFGAALGDND